MLKLWLMFLTSIFYGFQFTRYSFTDTANGDFKSYSPISIKDCESNCVGYLHCVGFVYRNSTNSCWIKSEMIGSTNSGVHDAYYKPPPPPMSQIRLTKPDDVSGYFDTQQQDVVILGSGFGALFVGLNTQYVQIQYLDSANETLFTQNRTSNFWNNTLIQLQHPSLDDLKYYNMYSPTSINVTVFNSISILSFYVKVKYPSNLDVGLSQGPFKCYFGYEAIKSDPFTQAIHMYSGEELKMTLLKPNGSLPKFRAIQKFNEPKYLNSNRVNNRGHRFGDLNAFNELETGYLFIYTSLGFLIYNNGLYLGVGDYGGFTPDIGGYDISDNLVGLWNCTNNFVDAPTYSPDSFQTDLSTFDVDLLTINIFGNSFGTFDNNLVNFVDFEMIKNDVVILIDSRIASTWTNSNISISYPALNDLRFFYGYKPDFVNIVVRTSTKTLSLQLKVKIPLLDITNSFQCYHLDGRIWKIDNFNIRLNVGEDIEILADNSNGFIPSDGDQVGLKENVTGGYLRHSNDFIHSNSAGGIVEDFAYLPMVTNQGFIFHNTYQYYWGRYIGYDNTKDELITSVPGDSNFMFWNCNIKYTYENYYSPALKTSTSTSLRESLQTTTVSTLKSMAGSAINITVSSSFITNSTDTLLLYTSRPSEDIYIGISPLSLLRESISLIFIFVVFKVLVRRYRIKHRPGKKFKDIRQPFESSIGV